MALVSPDLEEVAEARRLLASIGRETVAGWVTEDLLGSLGADERGHYEVGDFRRLAERSRQEPFPNVLDVRFAFEWRGGHIAGARNVAVPDLPPALPSLPTDQEIWVHCAGGYRAAIAASMLSGRGLHPVLIDDTLDNAVSAGLEVVAGP